MDSEDKAFLARVGQNIKRIRKEKGVSQKELALRCDFEKTSISRMESGRVNLTLLTLKKVADGLSIGIKQLVDINNSQLT